MTAGFFLDIMLISAVFVGLNYFLGWIPSFIGALAVQHFFGEAILGFASDYVFFILGGCALYALYTVKK